MLEVVKQIIEKQTYQDGDIITKVEVIDGEKLQVSSNNSCHLQDLLSSVINVRDVYLKEFSPIKGGSRFTISVH